MKQNREELIEFVLMGGDDLTREEAAEIVDDWLRGATPSDLS